MTVSTNIVNTLGAGSGIDIKALAQSLVDVERSPRKERIDAQISKTEAKISGYGVIKYALNELKTAFQKLNDAGDFGLIQAANTQPASFQASAGPSAATGSFNIEVLKIATAQRSVSDGFAKAGSLINGGQPFTLQLSVNGGDPQNIAIAAADSNPAAVVSAINKANLGISAQLINTGSGDLPYQIVVTGSEGASQQFTLSGVDSLGQAVSGMQFAQIAGQSAGDAQLVVNGVTVYRPSNRVDDVISGVTLDLITPTTGGPARLDLSRDRSNIKDNVKALVTAYNDFSESLDVMANRDSDVKDLGGALAGESLVQSIRSQVRSLIVADSDTPAGNIRAARDVGLSFDRDGKLQLDETKLDQALQNNFEQVVTMFTADKNNLGIFSTATAGLAGLAVRKLDEMTRSTGQIARQTTVAKNRIEQYQKDLEKLEERMSKLLTRYTQQFSAMESIVGNANSLRDSLTSSFEGLMAMYTKK